VVEVLASVVPAIPLANHRVWSGSQGARPMPNEATKAPGDLNPRPLPINGRQGRKFGGGLPSIPSFP
jgi:hypothetical protein